MSKKIRIGFAGAGWMGEQFLNKIKLKENTELVAVWDPNQEAAAEVLKRTGYNASYLVPNYEMIINNDEIDAVLIASPNTFHSEQSLKALQKSKHVFCEKPNSTYWQDHLKMVEVDHNNPNLVTMTNYTLYFNPMEQIIKKMVTDRFFGKITQLQVNYRHAVNINGDKGWKLKKVFVGDALGMGITHAIFLLCHFLSPIKPISVFAFSHPSTTRRFEVDPIWNITITFENGASGIVLGDIENGNSYDVYQNIFGTEGGLVYDSQTKHSERIKYWGKSTNRKWIFPLDPDEPESKGYKKRLWPMDISMPSSGDVIHHSTQESFDYFINHIEKRKKTYLGFENMRIVQDINFAAQLSAITGLPADIPADPEELKKHLG
ncbi:MAG: Gfo/Idh/MocA family oxidoreductase [Spirochaetales bacterium]|nr:Gfo/Idh/MocA family oxidoreductase [Spirochaetales bacterium]